MISPPLLKKGDKIGITATGRKVSPKDVEIAYTFFRSWGLEITTAPNLHSNAHTYLAGSDAERLQDFQQLIVDPDIKAIVCARGGYGTTRILDQLDFTSLYKTPKWIIGFSDVTALHLKLFKLGIKSIHGTMPILFPKAENADSIESLKGSLTGESIVISATSSKSNRLGKTTAPVIGGNLSLVVDAIGTSSDPDTNGKILILEEIDEYKYKVDRMFMHLKRSGKLDNLSGLIIGHMTDIKDSDLSFGETLEEVVLSKISQKNYPVAFNFPIGHQYPNLAWVHGSVMTLNVTDSESQLMPLF
ncbi:LD-carboxypeptidase [Chryseolinea sp. H1M3-3]|uniref:S66 peptidase family protein n=1 Tax=Chryseolinea sp. H1M3-3 TaxID=3034144 RepID=UPI0023ED295D|nr:LD-carboxypeptidase [Chryseolinea sp. H1M3-3]